MDLSLITVQDFKDHFSRDFPYLPTWEVSTLYNAGNNVYYDINKLFYKALNNGLMTTPPPSAPADWALYSDNISNYVLDSDITKAFAETKVNINQTLFDNDEAITLGFLYLAAHYLVNDLNAARDGISGTGSNVISSRSVGSVSESYAIPTEFANNPILSFYAQTAYGKKYLSFIMPRLVGNIGIAYGATSP